MLRCVREPRLQARGVLFAYFDALSHVGQTEILRQDAGKKDKII
jgi:hypothetical protein